MYTNKGIISSSNVTILSDSILELVKNSLMTVESLIGGVKKYNP